MSPQTFILKLARAYPAERIGAAAALMLAARRLRSHPREMFDCAETVNDAHGAFSWLMCGDTVLVNLAPQTDTPEWVRVPA